MASTGLSGLAGDIVALVKSPIAMLIAAIGAVIALGVKMWDKLTLSSEEYAKKLEISKKHTQDYLVQTEKHKKLIEEIVDSYYSLIAVAAKTDGVFALQIAFINKLERLYGNLQISVDKTTKSITGMAAALAKINEIEHNNTLNALQNSFDVEFKLADIASHDFFKDITSFEFFKKIMPTGSGKSLPFNNKRYSKHFIADKTNGLNTQLSTYNSGFYDENLEKLIRGWNKSGWDDNFQGKIDLLSYFVNDKSIVKTEESIQQIGELIEKIKSLQKIQKQLKSQMAFAEDSPDTFNKKYVSYLEQYANFKHKKDISIFQRNINLAANRSNISDAKTDELSDYVYAEAEEVNKYWNYLKGLKDNLNKEIYTLFDEIAKLKKQMNTEVQAINESKSGKKDWTKANILAKTITQLHTKILKLDEKSTSFDNTMDGLESKYNDLNKRAYNLKNASKTFFDNQKKSLNDEIYNIQAQLKGWDDLVAKRKLYNELTKQNINFNWKEINAVIKLQKSLGSLKLRQSEKEMGKSLYSQTLRAQGKDREAMEYDAINNARKTKGFALTKSEIRRIKTLANLQYDLNNFSKSNSISTRGILTNELAARGGFSSSVVADSRKDINSQILSQNKSQVDILNKISKELKKLGVIQ